MKNGVALKEAVRFIDGGKTLKLDGLEFREAEVDGVIMFASTDETNKRFKKLLLDITVPNPDRPLRL